ncbi:MAG: hypothetical protein ABRQ25_06275 [Clostridiaceae bacterium]
MGNGIIIKCCRCNFSQEYLLGTGFCLDSLDKILQNSHVKCTNIVNTISKSYRIEKYNLIRKLFHCNNCQNIEDISILSIMFEQGVLYEEEVFCSRCGKKLMQIKECSEISDIDCPECKAPSLTYLYNYSSWE